MNVRMRSSYSARLRPGCAATAALRLAVVARAGQHRQRRIPAESRVGFREPAQVERRSFGRSDDLDMRARRAQTRAGVASRLLDVVGHGLNGGRQPERTSWMLPMTGTLLAQAQTP